MCKYVCNRSIWGGDSYVRGTPVQKARQVNRKSHAGKYPPPPLGPYSRIVPRVLWWS